MGRAEDLQLKVPFFSEVLLSTDSVNLLFGEKSLNAEVLKLESCHQLAFAAIGLAVDANCVSQSIVVGHGVRNRLFELEDLV